MQRHQYGISALVSQTSFREETVGGVAKSRLFSQAMKRSDTNLQVFSFTFGNSGLKCPLS